MNCEPIKAPNDDHANIKGEAKKNSAQTLSKERDLDDAEQYSFNLLMDDDSESDDEIGESQRDREPCSAMAAKEDNKCVYHNLETFQKRQLKQKVRHVFTGGH